MTTERRNKGISRRKFLKASAGTAALLAAAKAQLPSGAFAQAAGPEVKGAKLGFIALTDAAPLFVAKEKGFFAKHGMPDTEVLKQASWGATRDNLVLGGDANGIDGAHILTPMPYLISAGKVTQNNVPTPMYILARLNLDSQCISVAKEYADLRVGLDTKEFKVALDKKKASGKSVKAANTFPGGTHDLWIRYWLAAGGIDPDKDIETITVPPPQMVANMKVGTMDCFCVCEPWNLQLVHQEHRLHRDHHRRALEQASGEVARHARCMGRQESECLQGAADGGDGSAAVVRQAREPRRGRAHHGQAPMDQRARYEDIIERTKGKFDYGIPGKVVENSPHIMKYWMNLASYPFQSHDLWFITEDIRWGKFEPNTDAKALIGKVNREDIWRDAAKALGVPAADIPTSKSRGKETFFDGKVFDPENPAAYLKSLADQARRNRLKPGPPETSIPSGGLDLISTGARPK